MTKDTIDTSQWKIDKTYLYESYYILMIEAMFRSDLIELSRNSTAKILSIGLGGGTIDSFLHEVFPQMDITVVEISRRILDMAKKWFGLVEDDHHRVEIVDGITFLAEKAKIGRMRNIQPSIPGDHYDAILVDACPAEPVEGIKCPSRSFYSERVLEDIAKLLPAKGKFGS
ncbi:unnamed protein product [Strongylus vulgaris]|uniref:PABS domain-containing protein n=1 Tax=Strongylus vulgaris TaxID=40348 RepID=A0A3P7JAT2_STRVU|nr:unnamed protein product [Strongylus vulgaris]